MVVREGAVMCQVKGCDRPASVKGLCGFHALQRHYRAEATPGLGLTAVRVPRPPRVVRGEPIARVALATAARGPRGGDGR